MKDGERELPIENCEKKEQKEWLDNMLPVPHPCTWGAIAYRLEGRTLNRENPVSNPTAVASNLWQV